MKRSCEKLKKPAGCDENLKTTHGDILLIGKAKANDVEHVTELIR
jgi:hypothetical protein